MSYSPPSDDAADFVRGQVAAGYYTQEDIEEAIESLYEEEPEQADAALEMLEAELRAHENAKRAWPATTDCDRLDAAFAALEERGIVARQNFACCNGCGHGEIQDVIRKTKQNDRDARGYVFFHMQDTDRVVRGEGLHLRFGTPGREPDEDIEVGRAILGALREHGLAPTWNEDPNKTIVLGGLTWQRRAAPSRAPATPDTIRRRLEGAMRGLVGAELVSTTYPLGAVYAWLREDERALAWARVASGGVRSAVADGATALALASVAEAFAERGDPAKASDLWVEAFALAPATNLSTLLALVTKAPFEDLRVFEIARKRAMNTEFDLWGGAVIAQLALRAGASMRPEERERLAEAAADVFERKKPKYEFGDDNVAQKSLASSLLALGKASPEATALLEAAREVEPEPRKDLDWATLEQLYEDGLVTRAELDQARGEFALAHAARGEREVALRWLAPILETARADCATTLAPAQHALTAIATGTAVADAMAAAMPTTARTPEAIAKAFADWSAASDKRALMKARRHSRTILAEARRLRDSSMIDLVLTKMTAFESFSETFGLPDLLVTMTALGRAEEAAAIASREFLFSAASHAAYAATLLALGDREGARAQVGNATEGPLRLTDVLDIAPATAGIHDDARAAATSLLQEITDALRSASLPCSYYASP